MKLIGLFKKFFTKVGSWLKNYFYEHYSNDNDAPRLPAYKKILHAIVPCVKAALLLVANAKYKIGRNLFYVLATAFACEYSIILER